MDTKPISWVDILRLLVAFGPEAVSYVLKKLKANGPVTNEELDELLALVSKAGSGYFSR